MAHYAVLDENNIVVDMFVGKDEDEIVLDENGNPYNWEVYYGAKRTSYNTFHGVHKLGGTPLRMNYAGLGYTYDESKDAFIPPKPLPSFLFNEEICDWYHPIEVPNEEGKFFVWNEEIVNWVEITNS
jgi:hypothetical protein